MKVLVIPDIHLKPWMFEDAAEILETETAEMAVCLMDIPDDWDQGMNLDLYMQTFDKAIWFREEYPDTLWCYGNHDLSYMWLKYESGFSSLAIQVVNEKLNKLREGLTDERQMAYIHRIDDVLFLHGGLTQAFAEYYATGADIDDIDGVISRINCLGRDEMWDDSSPIWFRPQLRKEKMYKEDELLQVVGHTPVAGIERDGNVVSCDLFSKYGSGYPIGTKEFLLIDTQTWEYRGVRNIYRRTRRT